MGFLDIEKVTNMGKGAEVYVNTATDPAYAYRVTKTDGSVAFEPLKPFVYWRHPQTEEFAVVNPADVNCPCCRPQPDNTTPDTPDCRPQPDTINPDHYKHGKVECIDGIESALTPEELRGYVKGNALKYIWREGHKNGDEDVRKAIWYLNRLVSNAGR